MIQSIDAEALIMKAADYFRLDEAELTKKRGGYRQQRALVMELLHRYSGLKRRMIGERFGGLDEGLVSRDRRAVREKIETDRRSESGFMISRGQVLKSRFDPSPMAELGKEILSLLRWLGKSP
jgi:chromosomal replication initiation ATPase DnaA